MLGVMKSKLDRIKDAQAYVSRVEQNGGDWQMALFEIVNDPAFADLFAGLSESEYNDLCHEISVGV